ncbi:transposase domain-containing protein [Paraburkholderia bryophila]|uniref:transposase domain-containing protein n=1 Tax=Paraburkholderia bryophila TaxID=420952 RepID=UPI003AF10560
MGRASSLVETCKANCVDPYRYLVLLFAKPPFANTVEDYVELLPWSLHKTRLGVSCCAGLPI